MHNYKLLGCDTDSIMFANPDDTPISPEEQRLLVDEINNLFPSHIKWDHDGYYKKVIYFKTKNYILFDGKKTKYKGSSLKSSTLEQSFKNLINEFVQSILEERNDHLDIYHKYVKEVMDGIQDIKPWCSKKTLTNKVYESKRLNETKVLDAVKGTEYTNGDKVWLYFDEADGLTLAERYDSFAPNYDKDKLLEKLYKTVQRFKVVLDISNFPNYKLKRNKELLSATLR